MPREFIAPDGKIYFRTKLMLGSRRSVSPAASLPTSRAFAMWIACCLRRRREIAATSFSSAPLIPTASGSRSNGRIPPACFAAWTKARATSSPSIPTAPAPTTGFSIPLSGETYQTDSFSCSCPDYQFRCKKLAHAALHCKHMHALFFAMEHGIIQIPCRCAGFGGMDAETLRHRTRPLLPRRARASGGLK